MPVDGFYHVGFTFYYNQGQVLNTRVQMYVDGVLHAMGHSDQTVGTIALNHALVLSANDEIRFQNDSGGGRKDGSNTSLYTLDVTDTSQVKVKFVAGSVGSGSWVQGNTDFIATSFVFTRLGDT